MSALRTFKTEYGDVEYDSDMEMGVLEDLQSVGTSGSLSKLRGALASLVASWPFKGDPSDPDAWRGLKRSEFAAVANGLVTDIGELGN